MMIYLLPIISDIAGCALLTKKKLFIGVSLPLILIEELF